MANALLISNIGTLHSGVVADPTLDADAVLVRDGTVRAIGTSADLEAERAPDVALIDANGCAVIPGLVDNHVHPVLGDWTPRQHQTGYLAGFVHGGVTRAVSAGETHLPGRPQDRVGAKSLALLAHKSYAGLRPGGLRLHAGALLLEHGLTEHDFVEVAEEGVHLVGEIGVSGVKDPTEAEQMTRWAQAAGMTVTAHFGGESVPGSRAVDGEFVCRVRPDVAAHANGGPTAPTFDDVVRVVEETSAAIEVVHNGNVRAARDIARLLDDRGELHRLVIGTDSPAGTGVVPLGILRVLSWLVSLGGLDPGVAVAAATGNTTAVRAIPGGRIEVGAVADLVIVDSPAGSQAVDFADALARGDTPAVAAVVVDGQVVVTRSRNTPPPRHLPDLGDAGESARDD